MIDQGIVSGGPVFFFALFLIVTSFQDEHAISRASEATGKQYIHRRSVRGEKRKKSRNSSPKTHSDGTSMPAASSSLPSTINSSAQTSSSAGASSTSSIFFSSSVPVPPPPMSRGQSSSTAAGRVGKAKEAERDFTTENGIPSAAPADRGQLLSSISGFNKDKLSKTVTNDRSSPNLFQLAHWMNKNNKKRKWKFLKRERWISHLFVWCDNYLAPQVMI